MDVHPSNYGNTYYLFLKRTSVGEAEDMLELEELVTPLVESRLLEFAEAKKEYKGQLEKRLQDELSEITSKETRRKQIYADMKEIQNVAL